MVERYPEPYPKPRAVHFDDETARLVERVGEALGVLAAGACHGRSSAPAAAHDRRDLLDDVAGRELVRDGLVEVASARWGTFLGCVPADHFEEIGQIAMTLPNLAGFEHKALYRTTATLLHAAGF